MASSSAVGQETDQGASGECLMTTNDGVRVVRDGASKNVGEALIHISLDPYQLKVYILAVSTLNVQLQSVEELKDFKAVFSELENAMPKKAVSITIETLDSLGVDTSSLQPFMKDTFVIQDHNDTYFVLTMGLILGNMSGDGYSNFLELASRHFFRRVYRDGDRADFLKRLVQAGHITPDCLYLYSDFIRKAGCDRQLHLLTNFQIRQKARKDPKPLEPTPPPIQKTRKDSDPLEPPPRPMIPISSAASDHVSLDRARVRSNGIQVSGIQEQTPLDQTNGSNGNKVSPNVSTSAGDSLATDQTDLSWGPPQDEEEGGDVQDIRDSNTLGQSNRETRPSGDIVVSGEDGDKTMPPSSTHRTADKSHDKVDGTSLNATDRHYNPRTMYKMTAKPRGIALIINNKTFASHSTRTGTDKDVEELIELFCDFGFKIKPLNDRSSSVMHSELKAVSKTDHSSYDCLVVCILTHGGHGNILHGTDKKPKKPLTVEKATEYFNGTNCPSLIGKPKVFIIQACRGDKCDPGVRGNPGVKIDPTDSEDNIDSSGESDTDLTDGDNITIPEAADFGIAYCTVSGYKGYRSKDGSYYIKTFVKKMRELAPTHHLGVIMTRVNYSVATEFESKQMPTFDSCLTKDLYFKMNK